MKIQINCLLLAASLLTVVVSPLHAQIVADGATNTLSNVTNTFPGDVTVGTNGSFTLLILSDNALLTNSVNGVIGLNLTARSNEVRLISASARWRVGGSLFVGSNGVANRLVVSNGAFLDNNGVGNLGNRVDSSNNFALVTGAGSLWSNRLDLRVGTGGRGNQLIVSNGGWVASRSGFVGNNVTSSNNFALVTGSGSVWSNALGLTVGFNGVGNRLVIEAGGLAHCDIGTVGDFSSAINNEALVTGSGSRWNVQSDLTIGRLIGGNRLVVSNGAALVSGRNAYIGSSIATLNNVATVTGAGSVWSNQNDLIVGDFASGNVLIVSNGATVLSSNLFVGFNSSATNNRVIVDGGTLRVTNAAGTGVLDVRRGTNVLNAGLAEVDQLLLTNTAGRFEFNGGTLSADQTTINNGQPFRVGNGVSAATFHLAGNGTHSFSNGLIISSSGVLAGNGNVIGGLTVESGGILTPGASIGKIILNNLPLLQGSIVMEISKNGSVLTNDQIQVTGNLIYGGTLTVSNIGPAALMAGDRFQLFPATSFAGTLETVSLPPLAFGLGWVTNLLVDGSIEVVSVVFTDIGAGLPGVESSSTVGFLSALSSSDFVGWGDYDNDGRLDIVLHGGGGSGDSGAWRNTGTGFTNIAGFETLELGSVASGDIDNDGLLDIVVTGRDISFPRVVFFRNTSTGFSRITNFSSHPPGVFAGSTAWGDYNNDGRLDLHLTGAAINSNSVAWQNTGNGFAGDASGISWGSHGSGAWGDYDNDGRLDILQTGTADGGTSGFSQIWRNTGSGFANINAALSGVFRGSARWGDYDNDGRLDILLTGTTNSSVPAAISQIWRNTGIGFTQLNESLPGVFFSSAAWGDYDNDGRLDILLTGTTNGTASGAISQIWRNTSGGFSNINAGLPGVFRGSVAWGDYDNDGRLDILLAGSNAVLGKITQVWRNQTPLTNTPPTAPFGLSASSTGTTVTLSWNSSGDAQTPASALTYNVRIGTTPGTSDVMGPMSSASGLRRLPQMGNAQERLFATFNATMGTGYYWSVQAIDTAFAGSPFSAESNFKLLQLPQPVPVLLPATATNLLNGDLNGDGVVDENELQILLTDYFVSSPFLQMTNVAGLGGTNVTFALTKSLAGAFSVEYTTNLMDWFFLGPATPRYLFTDTNAPAVPQRFYRLRWP